MMVPAGLPAAEVDVTVELVRSLIALQHPDLAELAVVRLAHGWDNELFRIGDHLTGRFPRREVAAALIEHDTITRDRLGRLHDVVDVEPVLSVWDDAVAAGVHDGPPMLLHGDLHPGTPVGGRGDGRRASARRWRADPARCASSASPCSIACWCRPADNAADTGNAFDGRIWPCCASVCWAG